VCVLIHIDIYIYIYIYIDEVMPDFGVVGVAGAGAAGPGVVIARGGRHRRRHHWQAFKALERPCGAPAILSRILNRMQSPYLTNVSDDLHCASL